MNEWLEDIAYGAKFDWCIMALAGAIVILIALTAISFQSVKAALTNPVKTLKTE